MDIQTLFQLYVKERGYQERVFGPYENNPSLNLSSFIHFIEETLKKAKSSYVGVWKKDLPIWLRDCAEHLEQGSAPTDAYEYLIKVFVLAGAALEAYTDVNVSNWRERGIKHKWLEEPRSDDGKETT